MFWSTCRRNGRKPEGNTSPASDGGLHRDGHAADGVELVERLVLELVSSHAEVSRASSAHEIRVHDRGSATGLSLLTTVVGVQIRYRALRRSGECFEKLEDAGFARLESPNTSRFVNRLIICSSAGVDAIQSIYLSAVADIRPMRCLRAV